MALDLSPPVVQSPIVEANGTLVAPWARWMSNLYQYIVSYINSSGIVIPQLTDAQIASIPASDETIMVQSSDTGLLHVRINNVLKTVTLT